MRVNAETAPKGTMRRLTLPGLGEGCYKPNESDDSSACFAGVVGDGMSGRNGKQHGKSRRCGCVSRNGDSARCRSGRAGWRRGP